ncbi:DUF3465 domain-containing protein [Aliagarivorans marinus]|uniref:DUF3465 domain-containing protein n=1 Tax=Aliagarivorans marinus TaxID=561965 RepID=UPI00040F7188|nr:DUF3465 domain-containing protein [Aliagarivorans marinus]
MDSVTFRTTSKWLGWLLALLLIVGLSAHSYANDQRLANAFANQQSNLQIEGQGIVSRILSDDTVGSRHQRFILTLASQQTLLVAHNIDLAPRIPNLKIGDKVIFYGVYEWNNKGGVIHWTHHDPANHHPHGWLKHRGKRYQ